MKIDELGRAAGDDLVMTSAHGLDAEEMLRHLKRSDSRRNSRAHVAAGAAIAVVLAVIVAVGLAAARENHPAAPGSPRLPTDSTSASPSAAGPALTRVYTSRLHLYRISYPAGWTATAATKTWRYPSPDNTLDPADNDILRAPDGSGWIITSQVIPATVTDDQWLRAYAPNTPPAGLPSSCFPGIRRFEPIVIDGHVGGIHGGLGVCDFTEAVVIVHHRAYLFTAKPNIDVWQDRVYDGGLFNRMLATVSFTS